MDAMFRPSLLVEGRTSVSWKLMTVVSRCRSTDAILIIAFRAGSIPVVSI